MRFDFYRQTEAVDFLRFAGHLRGDASLNACTDSERVDVQHQPTAVVGSTMLGVVVDRQLGPDFGGPEEGRFLPHKREPR